MAIERICPRCGMRGGPRSFKWNIAQSAYVCRNSEDCVSRQEVRAHIATERAKKPIVKYTPLTSEQTDDFDRERTLASGHEVWIEDDGVEFPQISLSVLTGSAQAWAEMTAAEAITLGNALIRVGRLAKREAKA